MYKIKFTTKKNFIKNIIGALLLLGIFIYCIYEVMDPARLAHRYETAPKTYGTPDFAVIVFVFYFFVVALPKRNNVYSHCSVDNEKLVHKSLFGKVLQQIYWNEIKEVVVYPKQINDEYRIYIRKKSVTQDELDKCIKYRSIYPHVMAFPYRKDNVDVIKKFYRGRIQNLELTDYYEER
mgnify:CR=1 FL=1